MRCVYLPSESKSTVVRFRPVSDELGPLKPEHGMDLVRLVIEPRLKPILKRRLDRIGVNRKSLFPDLDGLSDYVNWGSRKTGRIEVTAK